MKYHRIFTRPFNQNKSFFLFGPRGTGKTSLVKECAPQALYFDLLNSKVANNFLANPHSLEEKIPDDFSDWIVIDEVQKVPELLNEVHRLIETRNYKFILTGSSARKLRQKGVNLLAGRAYVYHMHPLCGVELQNTVTLKYLLRYGSITAIFQEADPQEYLDSYVYTYLKEEVMQEGLVRNVGAFSRFLTMTSFSQGSQLNMAAIAREARIKQPSIAGFFEILEDLLLGVRLEPFTKRAKRQMSLHPKFYYFDIGIFRTLRSQSMFDTNDELSGVAFETLIWQNLRAVNDYYRYRYKIYFWRTRHGNEVDFILYGERGFFAIEVKYKDYIGKHDCRGLAEFKKDYPEATLYLIYAGDSRLYFGDITVIPIKEALVNLPELLEGKHDEI